MGKCILGSLEKGARRMGVGLLLLVSLLLISSSAPKPARAISADELLDLMVDEGAITPAKAQKIKQRAISQERLKKAQEEAKRARELQQVKEEAKAETAQEAEAVVAKKTEGWKMPELPEALKGLKIGVLAYIDYSVGNRPIFQGPPFPGPPWTLGYPGNSGQIGSDQWSLTRGYLNVIKEITPWLSARWTPDLTFQNGTGWVLRQKYLYAELRPPDLGNVLTQMKGEIGLGHTPWHDFEESIYPYRCQGTVPIERASGFSSADIGVNLRGYFGGELPNAKELIGNTAYAGRFGSWHIGVYNGCGYSAFENNQNKVPEYRVTVRPFPDRFPGFQATYFGLYGAGNSTSASQNGNVNPNPFLQYFPDWIVNMGYLSYQHPWFILTAQAFWQKGNQAGNWTTIPTTGLTTVTPAVGKRANGLWNQGYSLFGDVKIPLELSIPFWQGDHRFPLHAFGRADWFNGDMNKVISRDAKYTRLIAGMAYYLYKNNLILLDYERTWYGSDYGANYAGPGTIGAGGNLSWPSSVSGRLASLNSNGGNLGIDQRFQVVFQISY
jgi:polyhydroxyalkanoate synthesis regulator phasin